MRITQGLWKRHIHMPRGAVHCIERNQQNRPARVDRRSRITLRSIRATHLKDHAKIAFCESFPLFQIDFRLRPYRASTPLRSNASRQQCRDFNDLQEQRVPNSATAFDNPRGMVLKEKIPLSEGRLPEASREVERVRCPRADLQSAPGRLGYQSPGITTGVGGASLDWDRRRRVTPAQTASQEAWPEAEPLGWNNSLR